ncbi:hypothetical protein NPIL_635091 [Nephila pilipes]|uniref:Uncharacterized protein n=1 Tax=Nephila pilipes TaxID=299642 RepID=A0A8X6UU19_NEPPI|nr:hypothetical protein NPIL_635091 [Nephila pilipes]
MKFTLIFLFALLALASASRGRRVRIIRPPRLHRGGDDYFSSLGKADVGQYRRSQIIRSGFGRYGLEGYRKTVVSGVAVGKAKVGMYSREQPDRIPLYG